MPKIKTLFLPRAKAWIGGAIAAAGVAVSQAIASGELTRTGLIAAAVLGVLAYAGIYRVPNTTPKEG